MGWRCRNFHHSHQTRPEKTYLFLLKLKKFESISSFDTSWSKYFGPRPVPSLHLWQWCSTVRCCVSLICRCGLFISEVFIWNNSLNFFHNFVLQNKNLLIVIHVWAYLFLLFDCFKAIFGHCWGDSLTDINHCIFNFNTTQSSPVVHDM